jgi:hypothetical protein
MLNGYLPPLYVLHSQGWKGCGILALVIGIFVALSIATAVYFGL